jgi:hypothetical protein
VGQVYRDLYAGGVLCVGVSGLWDADLIAGREVAVVSVLEACAMTRAEQVARLLLPCDNHLKDADWNENPTKQYCDALGCNVALCLRCAYGGHIQNTYLYGYCKAHQHFSPRP